MNKTNWKPAPKKFELLTEAEPGEGALMHNGCEFHAPQTIDLGAFVRDNDLEPEQVNAIGKLDVDGEMMLFGGGAAPIFVLRRVE